jgi:hypothetical protein
LRFWHVFPETALKQSNFVGLICGFRGGVRDVGCKATLSDSATHVIAAKIKCSATLCGMGFWLLDEVSHKNGNRR